MISLASSDADVLTVSLVVSPPDVVEGIILATFDLLFPPSDIFPVAYVCPYMYIWGRVLLFYCFLDCRDLSLSCAVVRSSSPGPPLSVYPRFQVAQLWKLDSPLPVGRAAVPGRILFALSIPFY